MLIKFSILQNYIGTFAILVLYQYYSTPSLSYRKFRINFKIYFIRFWLPQNGYIASFVSFIKVISLARLPFLLLMCFENLTLVVYTLSAFGFVSKVASFSIFEYFLVSCYYLRLFFFPLVFAHQAHPTKSTRLSKDLL